MKILFVCLGNICRSPMAEGILKHLVQQKNLSWKIDSAGTESYHVGQPPDRRAVLTCEEFGIDISDQRARRIVKEDFERFDIIYALAEDVLHDIQSIVPHRKNSCELKLLLEEISPDQNLSVPDPWYGSRADFEPVFNLIHEVCEAIVKKYSASRL